MSFENIIPQCSIKAVLKNRGALRSLPKGNKYRNNSFILGLGQVGKYCGQFSKRQKKNQNLTNIPSVVQSLTLLDYFLIAKASMVS